MATFSSLTAGQQEQILAFMPLFRGAIITLARACNGGASLDGVWTTGVSALVTSLDAGTTIPDITGLAGAQSLVREDVLGAMAAIEALLATANSAAQRAEYLKIVGPPNVIGV